MSRQNFYKQRQARQRQQFDGEAVRLKVLRERAQQPRLGSLKLYNELKGELVQEDIKLGRDKFMKWLGHCGLLLKPLPKKPKTTNSRHSLGVFTNLSREQEPTAPNQLWCADLTYISTGEGMMYLALLMDRYSRMIVGWDCSDSLEAEGCLRALGKALEGLEGPAEGLIHHSDRGCQYCCHRYVDKLRARECKISMTEVDHCAENAHAERLNGILKQEYALGETLRTKAEVPAAVEEAIRLYNTRRPHRSLGLRKPAEMHLEAA